MIGTAVSKINYSPAKAAAYADKYWKKYNRKYVEYRGVDCANFVSQCLYAGGMPLTKDWYPKSVNWINVSGHIKHFKSYGSFVTAQDANIRKGNPVYYDWNSNNVYDHVGICVGTNASGMPVVDAHTNNVFHVPWRMGNWGKRGTIVFRTKSVTAPAKAKAPSQPSAPVNGGGNRWKTVNGKVYYLGSNGKPVKNTFLTLGGMRYYFGSAGVRASGFFKTGGKWYYASVSDGHLFRGWQRIDRKIYYFSQKTYARITAGKYRIGNGYYCFNSKGQRKTGFRKVGGNWYYANKTTGRLVTGWHKINGKWYYFDKKTMVRAVGWKTINGKKCYFNSKGVLKKGRHG